MVDVESNAQDQEAWNLTEGVALTLILALLIGVGGYHGLHQGLRVDEMFTLETISGSLAHTWDRALHFELQPPLYFVSLWLWMQALPEGIASARMLSLTCGAASLVVVYLTLRDLVGVRAAQLGAACFALSPFVLWSASNARCYAFAALCVALGTLAFTKLCTAASGDRTSRWQVLFVIAWMAGLLTFYYVGFLLAVEVLVGLWLQRTWRPWILLTTIIGLLLVPWLPVVARQVEGLRVYRPVVSSAVDDIGALSWAGQGWRDAMLMMTGISERTGFRVAAIALLAILAIGSARRFGTWRHVPRFGVIVLATLAALVALRTFNFAPSTIEPRYVGTLTIVPLVLWIAIAVTGLPSLMRLPIGLGTVGIFAAMAFSFHRNDGPRFDWSGAAQYIGTRGNPEEPVYVFAAEEAAAYHYYLPDRTVAGIPHAASLDRYSMRDQQIQSLDELDTTFRSVLSDGTTAWISIRQEASLPESNALLARFVGTRLTVVDSVHVAGLDLLRVRSRRPIASTAP